MYTGIPCQRFDDFYEKYAQKIFNIPKNREAIDYLDKHMGTEIQSPRDLLFIYETLEIESSKNIT